MNTDFTISEKMRNNAHKIAFILQNYPEKRLPNILELMEMPAVDINSALWLAEDMGLIAKPQDDGTMKFLAEPDGGYKFGESVANLRTAIVYCLTILARREADLEEFFISKWTQGYPVIDVLVAMKSLLVEGTLAEYQIEDQCIDEKGNPMFAEDENTPLMDDYIFYTLAENRDKKWGRKDFKHEPGATTA